MLPLHTLLVFASACGRTTCPSCALGLVVCVFGGGGVCSPVVCGSLLPVSWFPDFIPSLLSAWAAHWAFPHTTHVPFRGVGGLLFFVCSLAVSTFSSALAAYRVREEKGVVLVVVTWSVDTLAPRFACFPISGGPWCVLSYICTFWRLQRLSDPCVCGYTSCSSCALGFVVCVFLVAMVRSRVACGSLLSVTCGCPSYHASFRAGGLEYREHRKHTWAVGQRRAARCGGLFGGGYVSLFLP